MSQPRIGSLCTGTGALDAAVAQVTGGRVVWHCEFADAPSKILAHRFPGVPNHRDLMAVDWSTVETVEILTAGFPCQDVSAAGARAGLRHGTRTGIFHGVMIAVRELRPRLVFLENVMGLFTADGDEWPDEVTALHVEAQRWARIVHTIDQKIYKATRQGRFDGEFQHRKQAERIRASRRHRVAVARFQRERLRLVPRAIATVLGALAEAGYDTEWVCVRASDVGAPHQRERVFLVAADSAYVGHERRGGAWGWWPGLADGRGAATDADEPGSQGPESARRCDVPAGGAVADATDAGGDGRERGAERDGEPHGPEQRASFGNDTDGRSDVVADTGCEHGQRGQETVSGGYGEPGPANESGQHRAAAADADCCAVREQSGRFAGRCGARFVGQSGTETVADAHCGECDGREQIQVGGPVERITTAGGGDVDWGDYGPAIERWEHVIGRPAPAPTEPGPRGGQRLSPVLVEWMMGLPAGWVTAVPGVSRNDQLKALGNGVVPQQAAAAYALLLDAMQAEWAA